MTSLSAEETTRTLSLNLSSTRKISFEKVVAIVKKWFSEPWEFSSTFLSASNGDESCRAMFGCAVTSTITDDVKDYLGPVYEYPKTLLFLLSTAKWGQDLDLEHRMFDLTTGHTCLVLSVLGHPGSEHLAKTLLATLPCVSATNMVNVLMKLSKVVCDGRIDVAEAKILFEAILRATLIAKGKDRLREVADMLRRRALVPCEEMRIVYRDTIEDVLSMDWKDLKKTYLGKCELNVLVESVVRTTHVSYDYCRE